VFGSGANHRIYAQIMVQSALANGGCKVCLFWGAGTRTTLWFYAMMRLLRLKQALVAIIHQQKFVDLTLDDSVRAALCDIKDINPGNWGLSGVDKQGRYLLLQILHTFT
jgi:hypothetical protein